MKWLMVMKDHFTRLVYARPITQKKPEIVAYELGQICALIGFPYVYQSDNGKEVSGSAVVDMLKEQFPDCKSVTGRSRKPRDQGSVERVNDSFKNVLSRLEADEHAKAWSLLRKH
jgi:hypothetical protein